MSASLKLSYKLAKIRKRLNCNFKKIKIIWLSNLLALSVRDEKVIPERRHSH
jgi:hypothetical protein